VGGNLHAQQSQNDEALSIIVFKLFASEHGYTNNWPFAWAVEYHIDNLGLKENFQRIAEELSNQPWSKLVLDSDFYFDHLARAVMNVLPDHFQSVEAVERAVNSAFQDTAGEPFQTGIQGRETSGRIRRNPSTSEDSLSDEEKNDVSQTARSWPYS